MVSGLSKGDPMNDIQYFLGKVGLEWHEFDDKGYCSCGAWGEPDFKGYEQAIQAHIKDNQLDPPSPADMAKIWKAFEDRNEFLLWLWDNSGRSWITYANTLMSPPDLYKALLTFFREKDDADS